MAADAPQLALGDVRREDEPVVAPHQLAAQVVFHLLANRAALRVEEDEALTELLLNREEVEVFAEPAVVAPLGLFALLDPCVQLFLRGEGRPVDALHLRAFGVAHPVRAGEREQLEGLEAVRVRDVRAEAEVYERRAVNVVDADLLAALVFNQLALQGLLALGEEAQRLRLRDVLAAVGEIALGNLPHPLLDGGEVFVAEHARRDDVVEEAVARVVEERGADAELRAGEEVEHGGGEEVRRRVTNNVEAVEGLREHGLDADGLAVSIGLGEPVCEVNFAPVDLRRQGALRRLAVELLERLRDRRPGGHERGLAAADLYVYLTHRNFLLRSGS